MKQKTAYIVVRIDYETDGRHEDDAETDALAGDLVVERALAHGGTVEDGIRIINITNCISPSSISLITFISNNNINRNNISIF